MRDHADGWDAPPLPAKLRGLLTAEEVADCVHLCEAQAGPVLRDVVQAVAGLTGIAAALIWGPGRQPEVVAARDLVMLAASERGLSANRIARAMRRDHTTVMLGIRRARARRAARQDAGGGND